MTSANLTLIKRCVCSDTMHARLAFFCLRIVVTARPLLSNQGLAMPRHTTS
jgi:hypothetical protein